MNRLFWKFFVIFWLAQFATGLCIGLSAWLMHTGPTLHMSPPTSPPPPLLPIVSGLFVSFLFAALLAWYFSRPLKILKNAFASISEGKFDTRIGTAMSNRDDELTDLGKNFDVMAVRLEHLIKNQQRLLHDVSHELRSPLARLQAAAGLIKLQPERSDEYAERIQRETTRMDILVGEILTIARLDAGIADTLHDEVNLIEVLTNVVTDANFEANFKRCILEIKGDGIVFIRGNPELLHRAFENVIRNAMRYSPQEEIIEIFVESQDIHHFIKIMDHGPGVDEGKLASIFQPFVRIKSSESTGYGLGLTITRRIVEEHGGAIQVANQTTGGLVVTFEFPKLTA